jgi:hypothetical protein
VDQRIESFDEFWKFYVGEHQHPLNRTLHFIGSSCGLAIGLGSLATGQLWALPAALGVGYGFAWVGHFFVEKNKPASFTYPLWSFRADWVMWYKILTGVMDDEVRRLCGDEAVAQITQLRAAK